MGVFKIFKPSELVAIAGPEEDYGPRHFIGEGAAYFAGTTLCWVTLVVEYEDEGCLSLELACDGPHPNHWFAFEMDCGSLDDIFDFNGGDETREELLFRMGIAPGQRFRIAATYHTGKYWTDCGYEYDAEVDWEVINIEPWTVDQTLAAWQRYLDWKATYD